MDLYAGYVRKESKEGRKGEFPYSEIKELAAARLTEGTTLRAVVMRATRNGAISLFLAKQYAGGGFRGVHLGPLPILPEFLAATAAALEEFIASVRQGKQPQAQVPPDSPVAKVRVIKRSPAK